MQKICYIHGMLCDHCNEINFHSRSPSLFSFTAYCHCLPSTVHRPLSAAHRPPSLSNVQRPRPPSPVCCPPPTDHLPPSSLLLSLSTVRCSPSTSHRPHSTVHLPPSSFHCLPSQRHQQCGFSIQNSQIQNMIPRRHQNCSNQRDARMIQTKELPKRHHDDISIIAKQHRDHVLMTPAHKRSDAQTVPSDES